MLIFDLDPQDPKFSAEAILEMSKYFVDSIETGKLYLNYPMVEAFHHMKNIPDPDYDSYITSLDELKSKSYKKRVHDETRGKGYRKIAENRAECNKVILQNIDKSWLVTGKPKPATDVKTLIPEQTAILQGQLEKLHTEKCVFVLCTCVFYIADYDSRLIQT